VIFSDEHLVANAWLVLQATLAQHLPELIAERAAQTLVGRPGTPDEVASLIVWVLGPDAGWLTGQILSPNAGAVLGRWRHR